MTVTMTASDMITERTAGVFVSRETLRCDLVANAHMQTALSKKKAEHTHEHVRLHTTDPHTETHKPTEN